MSEASVSSFLKRPVASRAPLARARQWLERARGTAGHERHTLALVLKSALAATLSWWIAYDVMAAQSPAFASFSAVLIMQVTVYQSLWQAVRYVGAVSLGVASQAALGLMGGPDLLTFALVAVAAMTIGRWRPLGSQGSQVATAAFFAFSTYVSATSTTEKLSQLGQIILLVLIGCGIGVVVNVVVMPPMRYRSAEHGIQALARSLSDLTGDMYPALREEELEADRTQQWRQRAARMGPLVSQAQASIRTAEESTYYNPRRVVERWRGRPHTGFAGYQSVVDALERVTYQTASMTRSLDQWHTTDDRDDRKDREDTDHGEDTEESAGPEDGGGTGESGGTGGPAAGEGIADGGRDIGGVESGTAEESPAAIQDGTGSRAGEGEGAAAGSSGLVGAGDHRFLPRYGEFLAALHEVTDLLGRLDETRLREQLGELSTATRAAQDARSALASAAEKAELPLSDPFSPYGVLLIEATRLMHEFQHTYDVLRRTAGVPDPDAESRGADSDGPSTKGS